MAGERLCPICKKPVAPGEAAARFRPFCSKRCADVDLSRWLYGRYAIPATEDESDSEAEAGPGEGDEGAPTPQSRH